MYSIMKKIKLNNDGFSFVELILLVTILAIISVTAVVSLSYFTHMNAKSGLSTLNSALDVGRYKSMSSDAMRDVMLYKDGNYWYAAITKDGSIDETVNPYKLVNSKFDITAYISANGSSYTTDAIETANISFNKSDGSLSGFKYDGNTIDEIDELIFYVSDCDKALVISQLSGRGNIEKIIEQ